MDFTKLSVSELKDAKATISAILKERSAEIKEAKKAEKAEAKAEADAVGKELAKVGLKVRVTYKGVEVVGLITKISDKTVTVKLEDNDGEPIFNAESGKQISTWKYFNQISAL